MSAKRGSIINEDQVENFDDGCSSHNCKKGCEEGVKPARILKKFGKKFVILPFWSFICIAIIFNNFVLTKLSGFFIVERVKFFAYSKDEVWPQLIARLIGFTQYIGVVDVYVVKRTVQHKRAN